MEGLLKAGAYEQRGEEAKINALFGAYSLADLVKSTLGPKGMDKILTRYGAGPKDGQLIVTNDGATILSNLHVDNSAAKLLVDISKAQDEEVGDGTTTVCVFAGELLREAEKLLAQRMHPQLIAAGWRRARDCALEALAGVTRDRSGDAAAFHEELLNIARTTISSKLLNYEKEHFAQLAVAAVERLRGGCNLERIHVIKKLGGSLADSFLEEGFLLEKSISFGGPRRKEGARVLVANTPMDYDKIKIFGARVKADSMERVAEIEAAEKEKMRLKVEKILAFRPDVFINRQLVYNYPEQLLSEQGVMVIEHADFEGVERLASALGADILSTFDSPAQADAVLGGAAVVEETLIGEDRLIRFSGCKHGEACTVVLRGSSAHLLDEAERSLHDALCVLVKTVQNRRTILGGGNGEAHMANAVEDLARTAEGKTALAIEAYARALRRLPAIIAENGGYDAAELVQNLSAGLRRGDATLGLDMARGTLGCMEKLGITECFRVKEQAISSASEAAEMVLRVDKIVYCAPRPREKAGTHN